MSNLIGEVIACGIGVGLAYVIGLNIQLRVKYAAAVRVATTLAQDLREAQEKASKAEVFLEEARAVFAEQLKRPAVAYFDDKQVHSLGQMLIQQIFVPATIAIRREIETKKA